jgi:hypothetical protein
MDVVKLRISAHYSGLVPAGRYFERLAMNLRAANARPATPREHREAQKHRLEERCGRRAYNADRYARL